MRAALTIIATIARHELRTAWRSRVTTVLALVLTVLTLTAAVVGQVRYSSDSLQRDRYQQLVGEQFRGQPDRHPHRVSHYGFLVFRPRAPLGFFDSGVENYAGTSIFLEAHRQNTANFSPAAQGGSGERFGELTLAGVLQLFVPLFIFGLAGVSVTREREDGTLPLLLCQGASWRSVLLGKAAGALLVVAFVLTPGLLLSLTWLAVAASTPWTWDFAARAGLLALSHLVYLVSVTAIAVTVSASQRTSRGALTTLVGLWILLWIVVPRVLPAVGTALYPVPSRAAFEADVERRVRQLGDAHNPDDPNFAALRAKALAEHGVQRVEELPFNYGGFVMQQGERLTSEAYHSHMTQLLDTFRRQAHLVDGAAIVNPYLAIRTLSMALAGSDAPHLVEFDRQAEAYRYGLIQSLNDLHMHEVAQDKDRYENATEGAAPSRLRIDRRFFGELPAFDYHPPPVSWALRERLFGVLTALVATALSVGLLLWTAGRKGPVAA